MVGLCCQLYAVQEGEEVPRPDLWGRARTQQKHSAAVQQERESHMRHCGAEGPLVRSIAAMQATTM
jgi:hypothetical protein